VKRVKENTKREKKTLVRNNCYNNSSKEEEKNLTSYWELTQRNMRTIPNHGNHHPPYIEILTPFKTKWGQISYPFFTKRKP
jgi:hypothetical protein